MGTTVITTKRLHLRPFKMEDASNMFKNWASDPLVTRFLTWRPHSNLQVTSDLLDTWVKRYKDPNFYNWAIEYNGDIIGSVSVVRTGEDKSCADLGYCIGSRWWGLGLMPEAASAVTEYLLNSAGFNKVRICHALKNIASGRVAQKCGFRYVETTLGSSVIHTGEALDIAIYEQRKPYSRKNEE